jgi:hypothetical protein
VIGAVGADGLLVDRRGGIWRGRICDEHRDCCASCDSCAHHHESQAPGVNSVFVTGGGQLFRAGFSLDLSAFANVKAPAARPILLVTTDRPAYKAGDTLRFRGVLRVPKTPLERADATRLLPAPERRVDVSISHGDATLFQRSYVTGEFGTFNGEFTLPFTADRTEYAISVTHEGIREVQAFEVLDYRKSDYAVVLEPAPGGVRVQAGYVWGAPVSGAEVTVTVDGKAVPPVDGVVPAKAGQRVVAVLSRGGAELARKSRTCRESVEVAPDAPAPPPPSAGSEKQDGSDAKPAAEALRVSPMRPFARRGEQIELLVEAPAKEGEATVLLADTMLYEIARTRLEDGRATARFPARALLDPGVAAFAIVNGKVARCDVRVAAAIMTVAIDAPASARPGAEVAVTLRAEPKAELSLAAVDEAIFMIREDDSPEIYAHFHPARPAAMAYARLESVELDGVEHKLDRAPSDPRFRAVPDDFMARIQGPSGGRYGGSFGGKRDFVARGGGGARTEDACLHSLRFLAAARTANGSWDATASLEAGALSPVGTTSLVLLSFVGAGYSHLSKDAYDGISFGDVVRKGFDWLLAAQGPDGVVGAREGDWILNHALAALALSEAFGLTGSDRFKEPAQRALDALCALPCADGGWHRADRRARGEPLASAFAVFVLKSAQVANLTVPAVAASNVLRYFDGAIDDEGVCGATESRATIAAGIRALALLREDRSDPRILAGAARLVADLPNWDRPDFLGWHLAGLALFWLNGPSGATWKRYSDAMRTALVRNQKRSWNDSVVDTALGTLALEIYYRYANAFGVGDAAGGGAPLAPPPRVRLYFPDTVAWLPSLVTDERGEARVTLRLPDQVTTTRLTARGVSAGAVGQALRRVAALQPFFVKLECPEFAVAGDEIDVRALLFNDTGAALSATVQLEGFEAREVTVPVDRPAAASWRVTAPESGRLRMAAVARAGAHADAMERTIPVRPAGVERRITRRFPAESRGTVAFEAPEGALDAVVRVRPRGGTVPQLLEALRWLNEYPHG